MINLCFLKKFLSKYFHLLAGFEVQIYSLNWNSCYINLEQGKLQTFWLAKSCFTQWEDLLSCWMIDTKELITLSKIVNFIYIFTYLIFIFELIKRILINIWMIFSINTINEFIRIYCLNLLQLISDFQRQWQFVHFIFSHFNIK